MKQLGIIFIMLITLVSSAYAEQSSLEKWAWTDTEADYLYAATVNPEGQLLGKFCYYKERYCKYMVYLKLPCFAKASFPALINSDIKPIVATLHCGAPYRDEGNIISINAFGDLEQVIKRSYNLSISIPYENYQFRTTKFSLDGSIKAIHAMERVFEEYLETAR